MELDEEVKELLRETGKALKGSARRLFMARTVHALGEGGQRLAERELGWNRGTIRKGLHELEQRIVCLDAFSSRGRKRSEEHLPNLLHDITAIVDGQSQADPQFRTNRLYTRLTATEGLCCKKEADLVQLGKRRTKRTIMSEQHSFKWRHFQPAIILLCVRWYLRYALSYRDLEEMMAERGLSVDHTTMYRWVQRYAPELEKRCRPHLKACNDSWRVDETYIKIKKTWMYLYRAVDSEGNTLEFLLSPARDAEAAKHFFCKALQSTACSVSGASVPDQKRIEEVTAVGGKALRLAPRVINVDKNAAYPKAIADLKAAGMFPSSVELRQVKDLNNLIEQDHRFIKRLVKPGLGFFSLETAGRTLQGYEVMNMIRKGQLRGVGKGDINGQVSFIASLFGVAT